VKGRECKVEKRRSRSLLLKDGKGRGGKRERRGRERGRRKGGEQPALTIKNRSRTPGEYKHQFGRPVKMFRRHGP